MHREGRRQEGEKAYEAKLEAQAKITKAEAEKIALDKVPGGTVKEGDIEKEKGKLLWSFDITTPGTTDITEVQVDAMSGAVVDVAKETVADQEKEKKEDAKRRARRRRMTTTRRKRRSNALWGMRNRRRRQTPAAAPEKERRMQ